MDTNNLEDSKFNRVNSGQTPGQDILNQEKEVVTRKIVLSRIFFSLLLFLVALIIFIIIIFA